MTELAMIVSVGGFALASATTEIVLERFNKAELAAGVKMFSMTFLMSGGVLYAFSKVQEVAAIIQGFGL